MSGGLDAGVTIYSKRVDQTYKEAFQTLQGTGASDTNTAEECDDGDEAGDGLCDEGVEDAATAAATQAKQQQGGRRKGKQIEAREEATLAKPEQLMAKHTDTTFSVDPLFHKMSALFDEGGANGLLLLNRSVYDGVNIMIDPHQVPEHQFPLQAALHPDMLIDMTPLQHQMVVCQRHFGGSGGCQRSGAMLTPGLDELYALWNDAKQSSSRWRLQQEQQPAQPMQDRLDVAALMAMATRNLPETAMPADKCSLAAHVSANAAVTSSSSGVEGMLHSQPLEHHNQASRAAASCDGVVAAFLATQPLLEDEEASAAAGVDATWGDAEAQGIDGSWLGDHDGYGDDGNDGNDGAGHLHQEQEPTHANQPSSGHQLLGLAQGGSESPETLDAEALLHLPGVATGAVGLSVITKKASSASAASGAKARAGQLQLDFEHLPPLAPDALAQGSRKQTCLVSAATAANTLLPVDLHFQAANFGQLFLKPAPISILRYPGSAKDRVSGGAAVDEQQARDWCDDSSEGAGFEGYADDDSFGECGSWNAGGEGYNAGDLSVGDPGFAAGGAAGSAPAAQQHSDWWSPDHELLTAPKRSAGQGVNHQRSAKQVDVKALKDLLWDSLVQVNSSKTQGPEAAPGAQCSPIIPFQDVISTMPDDSAAGSVEDVSVHMCFICLLHLANEKGLVIRAKEDLCTLTITEVPAAAC
eukprot:gene10048-10204_t